VGHVPHVYAPGEWSGDRVTLDEQQRHHLERVLRRGASTPVTYTDGQGRVGAGLFDGSAVERGDESELPPHTPPVLIAVAPPGNQDRCRFVVEKLAELGVDELHWITTRHTQGRAPRTDRSAAWAIAALQQSRGAWMMRIREPRPLTELHEDPVRWLIADPAADEDGGTVIDQEHGIGLVVGPEGGWADDERSGFPRGLRLGSTVLRTETAALVGATRCLQLAGRL
jgi:16S rRNA (uracil1498-N3)-methyltransferase